MSRLDEQLQNPASKFLKWSSDDKTFTFYEKFDTPNEKGEKGRNVQMKLPFTFLVLDILTTIKGYNDVDESGYYSNEIKDITNDILIVRTKKGIAAKGTYKQVMAELRDTKFCASVYAAIKTKQGLEMINLQLYGSAVSSWFDFVKDNKKRIYKDAIVVKTCVEKTKGKTVYYEPVFSLTAVTPETDAEAKELCKELLEYQKAYFKKPAVDATDVVTPEDVSVPENQHIEKGEVTEKLYAPVNRTTTSDDFPPPHSLDDAPPVKEEEEDSEFPF